MLEKAERCDYCNGEGTMGEYDGELFPMEDIFPIRIVEVVCPACGGSGEQLVEVEDDLELESS